MKEATEKWASVFTAAAGLNIISPARGEGGGGGGGSGEGFLLGSLSSCSSTGVLFIPFADRSGSGERSRGTLEGMSISAVGHRARQGIGGRALDGRVRR